MQTKWKVIIVLLILILFVVWLAALATNNNLRIISCDVGQGDATLVIYKNNEILIDGGPNNKVENCLSKYMPFWDRTIEIVILTHPQKDHYYGLLAVLNDFEVKYMFANKIDASSHEYELLKNAVGGGETKVISPHSGMTYRLGLIHLDILYPSKEFINKNSSKNTGNEQAVLGSLTTNLDANEFSIVARLKFQSFSAIFTGDIGTGLSEQIASDLERYGNEQVNYIKIPHHGSKNGLSRRLLDVVRPQIATISVGKDNSYGHPSPEILQLLNDFGVKTLRTDELGDVVIETDGEKVWVVGDGN